MSRRISDFLRSPGSIDPQMFDRLFMAGFQLKIDLSAKSRELRKRVFQQHRPRAGSEATRIAATKPTFVKRQLATVLPAPGNIVRCGLNRCHWYCDVAGKNASLRIESSLRQVVFQERSRVELHHRAAGLRILRSLRSNFWTLRDRVF
jgi:hypothetical protein